MINLACAVCKHVLRVSPGDVAHDLAESEGLFGPTSEWYPDSYPCPWCGSAMELCAVDSTAAQAMEVVDVTPVEALAALNGLGLPKENECSAEAVRKLLTESTVERVSVQQVPNTHRSVISYIEFKSGVRMYLGASSHGAVVYRITPAGSYVPAEL